mmetsp:Transcript_7815/g.20439  ORF Transcript_7815/g.20439 Transcript_7815/m.20439 type:complete len:160 (-) Transcript_7815:290-769(-)
MAMSSLAALAAFYAGLDDEELEYEVAGSDDDTQPPSRPLSSRSSRPGSSTTVPPAELPSQGEPRRSTHDGTMRLAGKKSPLRASPRARIAPRSDPRADRLRVRWAEGVTSPKPTRELLHKKARMLSGEEAPSASKRPVVNTSGGTDGKRRRVAKTIAEA